MLFSWKSAGQFAPVRPDYFQINLQTQRTPRISLTSGCKRGVFPPHSTLRFGPSFTLRRYAQRCLALMIDSTNTSLCQKRSRVSVAKNAPFCAEKAPPSVAIARLIWSSEFFMYLYARRRLKILRSAKNQQPGFPL